MIIRRISTLCLLVLMFLPIDAQESHMIRVFFRYGSIPVEGFENHEYNEVGGLYGGHVSLGIDSTEIGFGDLHRIHLFSNDKNRNSAFYRMPFQEFENEGRGKKYVTFLVPITDEQYIKLKSILQDYIDRTPYDYAFFGMRCTSATYEILSQIGLFPVLTRNRNIISNFYPKLLRRKMFKLASKNHFTIISQGGRLSRIWEDD